MWDVGTLLEHLDIPVLLPRIDISCYRPSSLSLAKVSLMSAVVC